MKRGFAKITKTAGAIGIIALLCSSAASADPTQEAQVLLKFCVDHPEACSMSIDYAKGGVTWRIDYNGTRLNALASTIKIVHLIAYASAVEQHKIQPTQSVPLDEWAQFWVGRDGGQLARAYNAIGGNQTPPPSSVTNDQIVTAMIQQSDNAAPDYLLNKLGSAFFQDIISRYIAGPNRTGYLDQLLSFNADFISWWGNPASPGSGIGALNDYSGFGTDEYREQLEQLFARMHDRNYMRAIRIYNQEFPPWEVNDQPNPPKPAPLPLNEQQYEQLEKGYSMRSNTRTYNQFMLELLRRNLLPAAAQAIVERFLESGLTSTVTPPLLNGPLNTYMNRYGVKDGNFSTLGGDAVRTRSIYLEAKDGTQVVFTVQLSGIPGTATDLGALSDPLGSVESGVKYFAFALATNPAFALQVETELGAKQDAQAPSLIARVVQNTSTATHLHLKVAITNIGTAATNQQLEMALYAAGSDKSRGPLIEEHPFPVLKPGERAEVDLGGHTTEPYLMLVIDPENVIPANQKQDNPQVEINNKH